MLNFRDMRLIGFDVAHLVLKNFLVGATAHRKLPADVNRHLLEAEGQRDLRAGTFVALGGVLDGGHVQCKLRYAIRSGQAEYPAARP